MRLPRRQPRAVYVVRDADDLLSEPESGEPVTREDDRLGSHQTDPAGGTPLRHVLAGMSLVLIAVFAVVLIVLGLLSLAGRHGDGLRQAVGPSAVVSRSKIDKASPTGGIRPPAGGVQQLTGERRRAAAEARHRQRRLVAERLMKLRGPRLRHGTKWLHHAAATSPTGAWPDPGQRSIPSADVQSRTGASITFTPVAAVDEAANEFGFER